MADELVFYSNPMSRARIVRWMLEEVGAPYRTENIEYGPPMKSPEYLAINPMGKVPAIRHGAQVVTEVAACLAYLADAFPEAGLGPDAGMRGAYYRWLFFFAGPFDAVMCNKLLEVTPPADKERMLGYGRFDTVMDTLEKAVSEHEFVAGDRFTAADVFIGASLGWHLQWKTIESRPAFVAYAERAQDRDAFRRANEIDEALMNDSEGS